MLRQADNIVKIDGKLSEINLDYRSYLKDGKPVDAIGGNIKIKTTQEMNGKVIPVEIPVNMFAQKYTKTGELSKIYSGIEKIMTDYCSIASDGEQEADNVRISRGNIQMNEYYSNNTGALVSFPRITSSFISKIPTDNYTPKATFSVQFVVASKEFELDKDGAETGRLKVMGVIPQYGGRVDVVPFYSVNENVTSAISEFWEVGDTVNATGRLMFTTTTTTVKKDTGFGEAQEEQVTRSISELLITGGSQEPLLGESAYDSEEIQAALAERKARLEKMKEQSELGVKSRRAPAKKPNNTLDLGF